MPIEQATKIFLTCGPCLLPARAAPPPLPVLLLPPGRSWAGPGVHPLLEHHLSSVHAPPAQEREGCRLNEKHASHLKKRAPGSVHAPNADEREGHRFA